GAATHLSDGGNLTIQYTGCVFSGNSATDDGGAVANFARVITPPDMLPAILEPRFTNCTFTENDAAEEGGALYFLGFLNMGIEMLNAEVENSILYANTALIADPEIFNTANTLISHSLIQGSGGSGGGWDIGLGTDGGSNIDDDPLFSDPLDPDGVDGIAGTADDGLFPTATSPVIEQGNNAAAGLVGVSSDFVGAMRLQGSSVDMGAYEQEGSLICGPLPAGLSNQDIGNTGGYPGTVCYDAGTFEVDASGSGIWGRRDGFHFVFKTMNGNGEIIAQVDGIGFNSFWDMGGVMMRESLHRNSKNVFMGVNAGGKAFYQRRRTTNGLTAFLFAGNGDTPKWVRIIRFGNFFACYKSVDGSNWQWTGLFYVPMPHRIYVGLATSTPFFLAGTPNTYEFSNLSIQGISYLQPPFNESQLTEIEEHEGPREGLNPEAETFKLFPNPITSHSLLEVHLLQTDQVSIEMFDIQGRKLKEIYQGELQANQVYRFPFKKGKLAQGLYVIKMKGQQHDQFTYVQIGK
ncbi:MAG: choice-of-anchor Q domain-containing protein, partial [Bacteroidota bacterium]